MPNNFEQNGLCQQNRSKTNGQKFHPNIVWEKLSGTEIEVDLKYMFLLFFVTFLILLQNIKLNQRV